MILTKALILLFVTLIPGLIVIRIHKVNKLNFRFLLIFSGAFLLSITILHILPELFIHADHGMGVAIFILIGLFVQMILESFTSGIEHGHRHDHGLKSKSMAFPYGLMIALSIHSLLEGAVLAHGGHSHGHGMYDTLMFGVALHKIPAAIALVSVIMSEMNSLKRTLIILIIFSLSSPMGILISAYLQSINVILESGFEVILALAAGSFIYISSTILFEARQDHRIKLSNVLPALLGALIAIIAEVLI